MEWNVQAILEQQRNNLIRNYRELNRTAQKGKTVLAGSSLTEYFRINEMLMSRGNTKTVYNRGVAGMTVAEYDKVLDIVLDLKPSKILSNIGTNDLNLPGDTVNNLIRDYRNLLIRLKNELPDCDITLLAYYPCRKGPGGTSPVPGQIPRTLERIEEANVRVKALAQELDLKFVDLNSAVAGEDGYLKAEYALDSIHFSQAGYEKVLDLLEPLL